MNSDVYVVGIHQPNFFPWKGYFDKMRACDVFVLLDNVDIVMKSSKAITHRTRVKTYIGDKWITLPLIKNEGKLISDILCHIDVSWKKKTMELIRHNYLKAPNYDKVVQLVDDLLPIGIHSLARLNGGIIRQVAIYLGIPTPIVYASDMGLEAVEKNERIIEIVRKLNGVTYLSGNGGRSYNDHELFNSHNISIDYVVHSDDIYDQLHGQFIPGLGILDYLFNVPNGVNN